MAIDTPPASPRSDSPVIRGVRVNGRTLPGDTPVEDIDVDLSIREASRTTIRLIDSDLILARRNAFYRGARVDVFGEPFVVTGWGYQPGPGRGEVELTCHPPGIRKLRRRRGAQRISQTSAAAYVQAECRAVGLRSHVQPSGALPEVVRDQEEPDDSAWSTFTRLASSEEYVVFEARGTIYFGSIGWLLGTVGGPPLVGVAPDIRIELQAALDRGYADDGVTSSAVWTQLLGLGWRGDPRDSRERLLFPAAARKGYVEESDVTPAQWERLLFAGWRGQPTDGKEALYPPRTSHAPSQGVASGHPIRWFSGPPNGPDRAQMMPTVSIEDDKQGAMYRASVELPVDRVLRWHPGQAIRIMDGPPGFQRSYLIESIRYSLLDPVATVTGVLELAVQ